MTQESRVYLELPILPMQSIGGITIGDGKQVVLAKLGEPLRLESGKPGFEFLDYLGLSISLRDETVYLIRAEKGYRGATPQGLRVGAQWLMLLQIYPNVTFHEDERLWYVPGINGLSFDVVRPLRSGEKPLIKGDEWFDEEFLISDPENAFILSIAVHQNRFE